jgi:molybdopterin-guanine dinucleotide biosynthesis protein A
MSVAEPEALHPGRRGHARKCSLSRAAADVGLWRVLGAKSYDRLVPSAAILAGGKARRFAGREKAALVMNGRTILERQIAELASMTDDILLVGRRDLPGWATAREDVRVRAVPDRMSGLGPLGGLDTALAEAHHEALVIVACDMPFVTGALLAHLAGLTASSDAVVPSTGCGPQPLCAVYTRACRTAVTRCLSGGRLAMVDLLEEVRVHWVTREELEAFGEPDRLFANINTADEYAELCRQHE